MVAVRRAGDVIPEVAFVDKTKRNPTRTYKKFTMPSTCPVCNSVVIKEDDKAIYRCSGGLVCSAQVKFGLIHYTSRLAMNIESMGEKVVEQAVDKGFLKDITDFYKITKNQFICEIDVFHGDLDGLVLAEIEIDNIDRVIEVPDTWIDVTNNKNFLNSNLIKLNELQAKSLGLSLHTVSEFFEAFHELKKEGFDVNSDDIIID